MKNETLRESLAAQGPLTKLRKDMGVAGIEAYEEGKDETDACLEILDEFMAAYEVLEVVNCLDESYKPPHRRWDEWPVMGRPTTTILVPRARKPSLREAAEVIVDAWNKEEFYSGGYKVGSRMDGALDALAAALQEEER